MPRSQYKLKNKKGYLYYCLNCEASFDSLLPKDEAVCLKCGTSKILGGQGEHIIKRYEIE